MEKESLQRIHKIEAFVKEGYNIYDKIIELEGILKEQPNESVYVELKKNLQLLEEYLNKVILFYEQNHFFKNKPKRWINYCEIKKWITNESKIEKQITSVKYYIETLRKHIEIVQNPDIETLRKRIEIVQNPDIETLRKRMELDQNFDIEIFRKFIKLYLKTDIEILKILRKCSELELEAFECILFLYIKTPVCVFIDYLLVHFEFLYDDIRGHLEEEYYSMADDYIDSILQRKISLNSKKLAIENYIKSFPKESSVLPSFKLPFYQRKDDINSLFLGRKCNHKKGNSNF